jgi:hypothetical protein
MNHKGKIIFLVRGCLSNMICNIPTVITKSQVWLSRTKNVVFDNIKKHTDVSLLMDGLFTLI